MSLESYHHLPTYSRHNSHNRLCLATATKHQGYEDPCCACINAGWFPPFWLGFVAWALHAVRTQSLLAGFHCVGIARNAQAVRARSAQAVRKQCTNLA